MKLEKRLFKTAMHNIVEYTECLDAIIHLFKNSEKAQQERKDISTLWYKVGNAIATNSVAIWLNDTEVALLESATEYVEENLQYELNLIIKERMEVK